MIVCKDCGHKNQNQTTFCEACGTFLEWAGESVLTGQHQAIPAPDAPVEAAPPAADPVPAPPPPAAEVAAPPPPPTPAAEPPPSVPPPGATGAAFQAQRLPVISAPDESPPAEPPPVEAAAATPPATPPPPAAEPTPEEPKAPAAARPGTQVLRAMRMKARPPAPPPAAPAGPTARPPAEEHERRPPKPPSVEPPRPQGNPGDVFCSACGTPNDPTRHYCRSCGAQLAVAAAAAAPMTPARRVPWWRRIFGGGKGQEVPPPAGTRPASTGKRGGAGRTAMGAGGGAVNSVAHVARRFFQVVAILGALGIAVVAIGPWRSEAKSHVSGWFDDVRRVIQPRYVKVTPTKITASSSLKNNPPQNAFDGIIETFWAEGAHGDGAGQSITATFAKPTDLARVGLTLGDQSDPKKFATRPVPRSLSLVFYDANGGVVKRETVTLEQTPKFQKRDASANGVKRVVITIRSTYPPVTTKRSSASIAEIELFTKD